MKPRRESHSKTTGPGPTGAALSSGLKLRHRSLIATTAFALALALTTSAPISLTAAEENARPADTAEAEAEIRVRGMGWFQNRKLRQTLHLLEPDGERRGNVDAAFIEDSVVLLQSALEREGFLQPQGEVLVRAEDGSEETYSWTAGEVPSIPRETEASRVVFSLEPGVRYTFDSLTFSGLEALREKEARNYFLEEGFLLGGGGARRFTPGILRQGVANLREQLVRLGHFEAAVEVASEERNPQSGEVDVAIAVEEGPLHRVGRVAAPANLPAAVREPIEQRTNGATGATYSPLWQQDFVQTIRAILYRYGFAEADVSIRATDVVDEAEEVRRDFELVLEAGPQVRVGQVNFSGEGDTATSVLLRAVEVESGDLFDRGRIDQDRLRLGNLGIFSSIRAEADKSAAPDADADHEVWDLNYLLEPGRKFEVSLLAGYGSYEQLRGGIEVFHANYFGRAHRGRLKLIQSMRSSSGDYLYTIPQVFGTSTDVSARLFGLAREYVSFDRRQIGASIGARRHVGFLGADVAVRYQYESDTYDNITADLGENTPEDSFVGAVSVDVTRDRLDNPISPRDGYIIAATLETASKIIGGERDYQRFDIRAAWHKPLGGESYLHVGFRHGLIWSTGEVVEQVPPARRFYPGGEGTLRGYREGTAAPKDADGNVIGAQASTILNLEFEQRLTRELSAVIFVDGGLTGETLNHYPGGEGRVSVGLGLRYDTVIGPARLEYGYNALRVDGDRTGTLHFALGFPF